MAQPAPLTSPEARQVCGLSGVQAKISSQKLVTLKDLEKALGVAIQQADAGIRDEKFWTWALIAAKTAKLAADVMADVVIGNSGGAGKIYSMAYGRASMVAETLSGEADAWTFGQQALDTNVDAASETLKVLGKEGAGKVVSNLNTLGKSLHALKKIYDDYRSLDDSGTASARRSMVNQLRLLQGRIASIERDLAACGLQ